MFFNDMKPGLKLIKVDSDDPSKVIPNAVFEIKSVEGTYGPRSSGLTERRNRPVYAPCRLLCGN